MSAIKYGEKNVSKRLRRKRFPNTPDNWARIGKRRIKATAAKAPDIKAARHPKMKQSSKPVKAISTTCSGTNTPCWLRYSCLFLRLMR